MTNDPLALAKPGKVPCAKINFGDYRVNQALAPTAQL
jgi:hypothetical protein